MMEKYFRLMYGVADPENRDSEIIAVFIGAILFMSQLRYLANVFLLSSSQQLAVILMLQI